MSDAPDRDSQTEEASEKKVKDALDKGNVPVSRELGTFVSLAALLLASALFLHRGTARLMEALARILDDPGGLSLRQGGDGAALFRALLEISAAFLGPTILLIVVFGLGASFLQNPPRLVLDRLLPDPSRISPRSGWSRLFGFKGQIEFGKAAFKLVSFAIVMALLIRSEQGAVLGLMRSDPRVLPDQLLSIALKLLSATAVATGLLVAIDLVWARISWRRDLRMTKQEVKEEHREAEGDPAVKARRRSIALNRSRKRMMAAVPTATLVVANPTHFAVALRYRREDGGVPLVVAKGQDLVALRIRAIAEENGIPVIEDKPLARSMYDAVQVDGVIPATFYRAVAELIHYLGQKSSGASASMFGKGAP